MMSTLLSRPHHAHTARLALAVLPVVALALLGPAAPAGAVPEDFYPPVVTPEEAAPAPATGEGRPCFLVRHPWNEALDRTQPVC